MGEDRGSGGGGGGGLKGDLYANISIHYTVILSSPLSLFDYGGQRKCFAG